MVQSPSWQVTESGAWEGTRPPEEPNSTATALLQPQEPLIHLTLRQEHGRYWCLSKHIKKSSTGAKKTDEIERKKNRKQINPKTVLPSYIIDKTQ